jgi:hypothetical protein
MAVDVLNPFGFVATSLATALPAHLKIGCIWKSRILYKKFTSKEWVIETMCCPELLGSLESEQEDFLQYTKYIVSSVVEYGMSALSNQSNWITNKWRSVPFIVENLLDMEKHAFVPYTLLMENEAGFVV